MGEIRRVRLSEDVANGWEGFLSLSSGLSPWVASSGFKSSGDMAGRGKIRSVYSLLHLFDVFWIFFLIMYDHFWLKEEKKEEE